MPSASATRRVIDLHRVLAATNRAILRARGAPECLREVADILVNDGGFLVAWIGLLGDDGTLDATAVAGPAAEYVQGLRLSASEADPRGRGPAGTALRSGKPVTCNRFQTEALTRRWHARAKRFGIHASTAFPLRREDRVVGLLSIYSAVPDHFGPRELALVGEVAADLGFGLEQLARDAALAASRERLEATLARLHAIESATRSGLFSFVLPDGPAWWSEGAGALFGVPPEVAPSLADVERALPRNAAEVLRDAFAEAAARAEPVEVDLPVRPAGGKQARWFGLSAVARRLPGGGTEISGVVTDTTERKRLESKASSAARAERERLASELHDHLGQVLTGVSLLVGALDREARAVAPQLGRSLDRLGAHVAEALHVCRTVAHEAAPSAGAAIAEALGELAARVRATGVECRVRVAETLDARLGDYERHQLFRIAQEATTNALKHSGCSTIDVTLAARPDSIELTIADDGAGMPERVDPGLGLRTMRYRAARLGGALTVRAKARGTTVRVALPLPAVE